MQGRLLSPVQNLRGSTRRGLALSLVAATLLYGGCRKSHPHVTPNGVTPDELLSPHGVAAGLIARGGAHISATTHFSIVPSAPEGLLGAQDITTTTTVLLGADGRYSLHEENNHDGGRDVFFSGGDIAVKLRYGKLIKRSARPPEPMQLLEQALGGPGAAWDVFRAYAQTQTTEGPDTFSLSLAATKADEDVPTASSPLIDWRKTAVPTELKGKLRYLPASAKAPAVLVAAEITGRFTARTTTAGKTHDVQGRVEITFAARDVGHTTPEPMPADAETAWMRQRTILEERALLGATPAAKTGLPP